MKKGPITVFCDASTFIKVGAPPGKETFRRLVDLVNFGFIRVVTTQVSLDEIVRHHMENTMRTLRPLAKPNFRQLVEKHFDIELPQMSEPQIRYKVWEDIDDDVEAMFLSLNAIFLDIDEIKPSVVFDQYDRSEGLFVSDSKKSQFPDAFIFECLKRTESKNNHVYLVSNDGDFENATKCQEHITLVNSLEGLFYTLGLVEDEPNRELGLLVSRGLLDNLDFKSFVEQKIETDRIRISTALKGVSPERITAFKQINENEPMLISAEVSAELDVWVEKDLNNTYSDSNYLEKGAARVSIFASLNLNEEGDSTTLSDLQLLKCEIEIAGKMVMYFLGEAATWSPEFSRV